MEELIELMTVIRKWTMEREVVSMEVLRVFEVIDGHLRAQEEKMWKETNVLERAEAGSSVMFEEIKSECMLKIEEIERFLDELGFEE